MNPTNALTRRSSRISKLVTGGNSDCDQGGSTELTPTMKITVLIDSLSSSNIHRKGFSCAGCGGYGDSYVVGTLNSADRLNVWCIECFAGTDQRGYKFDAISSELHVPEVVVEDILRKVSAMTESDIRGKLQSKLEKVSGCKSGCSECMNIDALLANVWMTEIDSWYGEGDDDTVPLAEEYWPPCMREHQLTCSRHC